MKSFVSTLLLLALLTTGFYVAWPAWSLQRVADALRRNDDATLAQMIDFPGVRASMRPALTEEVTRRYEQLRGEGGGMRSLLANQLKADVLPKLVDTTLDAVVTPVGVLQLARNRVALREAIERVLEQRIVLGGSSVGQAMRPPPAGTGAAPAGGGGGPRYTTDNIKRIALAGPLSIEIGVNRNPAAAEPELLVQMAFTGADWKIVGLAPRF